MAICCELYKKNIADILKNYTFVLMKSSNGLSSFGWQQILEKENSKFKTIENMPYLCKETIMKMKFFVFFFKKEAVKDHNHLDPGT